MHEYMLNLLHKIEEFLASMRWKTSQNIKIVRKKMKNTFVIDELMGFKKVMLGIMDKFRNLWIKCF